MHRAPVLTGLIVLLVALAACAAPVGGPAAPSSAVPEPAAPLRIGALKGPTYMGLAKLASDAAATPGRYAVTLAATPDELTPRIVRGDLDIALVPANLGALLNARTDGQIKVVAVNTLGVLKVMTRDTSVTSLRDLKGKTILNTGKGASPEFALHDLLRGNGIDPTRDLTIEYRSEATEVVAALTVDPKAVGVVPDPFATILQVRSPGWRPALDLTTEWTKVHPDSQLVMGVTVVRVGVWQQRPDAVRAFLADSAASVDFLNSRPAEAAPLLVAAGLLPDAATAEKAIPASHVVHLRGAEARAALLGYLKVLHAAAPDSVGGRLPDDSLVLDP